MARYFFSGYEIDVDSREIRRNGHRVPVQPQPFLTLVRLLETPGEVVGRTTLIRLLWGETNLANPDHSLNIAVRKLRDALDDAHDQPRFIETVARVGYRFIGRLEVESEPSPAVAEPQTPPPGAAAWRKWVYGGMAAMGLLVAAWMWGGWRGVLPGRTQAKQQPATHLKLLWDEAASVGGRASADGRYYPYTDWKSEDVGIGLRDLMVGVSRKLTRMPPNRETHAETHEGAVSPDGRFVAFGLHRYPARQSDQRSTLEVIDTEGQIQRTILKDPAIRFCKVLCWTPDSRAVVARIVFHNGDAEGRDTVALVDVESGQLRILPTAAGEYPSHAFVSPDGQWLAYSTSPTPAPPSLYLLRLSDAEKPGQKLFENAAILGWSPDGQGVAFLRRREGAADLYFQPLLGDRPAGEPVLLHPSIDGGILPAGITNDGTLVYSSMNRRTEAVVLPAGEIANPAAEPLVSFAVPEQVSFRLGPGAAHFSPTGKRLFVITPERTITIHEMDSGATRTIKPKLKTIRAVRWGAGESALLVLGQDDAGRPGIFRVDDTTGKASLLAAVPAKTWSFTPSRDGRTLFFGTPLRTQAIDLGTGKTQTLLESEEEGNYDLRVSHDGQRLGIRGGRWLAVRDLASGKTRMLHRQPATSPSLLWAMEWSPDDQEILTIARPGAGIEQMELWSFPSQGGLPRKEPIPATLSGLSFTPDGRYLLTTRTTQRWQVWALQNFLPVLR